MKNVKDEIISSYIVDLVDSLYNVIDYDLAGRDVNRNVKDHTKEIVWNNVKQMMWNEIIRWD